MRPFDSLLLALSLLALSVGGCTSVPSERPPDIVVVLVDTLRADAPSHAGGPPGTSPALDALVAEHATWFSKAYASSSWTLPSAASLLTGLHPWQHRVTRSVGTEQVYGRLPVEIPTLGAHHGAYGYRTAAWINNVHLAPEFGLDFGFDVYDYEGAGALGHRTAGTTVAEALAWLNADDTPAFLLVHLMEPHADYDPGPEFKGKRTEGMPHAVSYPLGAIQSDFARARLMPSDSDKAFIRAMYEEEVMATDAAIGKLVEGLRAREGWDETILVVTSDHGEEFWEYGFYEHGHSLLSPVSAVPLIVKAKGFPANHRVDAIVDHLQTHQLLATGGGPLLDLANAGEVSGGRAMGQGILYGEQAATVTTTTHRAIVELGDEPRFAVFRLDEAGHEIMPPLDLVESEAEVRPVIDLLVGERGGLGRTEPVNARPVDSAEVFEQLRSLGYVE